MNLNICNNCGGEYEYRNGFYICRACGALKPEEISNEEVTLLYTAYQKLRLADFDEAEKEFDDIVLKYPKNPNGYWGRLMSKYGIKYEQDYDGRMIPTCYATSIECLFFSADYKKALEYADGKDRQSGSFDGSRVVRHARGRSDGRSGSALLGQKDHRYHPASRLGSKARRDHCVYRRVGKTACRT